MDFSIEKRNRYLELMIRYQKNRLQNGEVCNIIGNRVNYFRNELGLNRNAFCKYAKIERTTLYKIEEGKITPSLKTLIKIVDALGVVDYGFVLPEEEFDRHYTNSFFSDLNLYNIYVLEDEITKLIQNKAFGFYQDGKVRLFPQKYFELLMYNIHASFSALNLVDHDEEQGKSFLLNDYPVDKSNSSKNSSNDADEDDLPLPL